MSDPFEKSALFPAPDDLTVISDDELQTLESEGVQEFDRVHAIEDYTPEHVQYAMQLREDLDRIKAELSARRVREDQNKAAERLRAQRQMTELQEAVHGPAEGTPEAVVHAARMDEQREEAIAAAASRGATEALLKLLGDRRPAELVQASMRNNATLAQTAAVAPKPKVPEARLAVTAAGTGQEIPTIGALASAFIEKAQSIPVSQVGRDAARYPVARIRNDFAHTVDNRTGPAEIEELWRELVNDDTTGALVAGGGWCAPSEQLYDFFNIADADGMIDLPTVGVTRGGIKFPVSPAIGDVFFQAGGSNPASGLAPFAFAFSNASDPWLWTESDDILTVTGSVNKPTLRVPCPTFSEVRLEAYGLSLTAGNLTDSAYPEATQNFLRLLRAAYSHAINARLIALMVAASAAAESGGDFANANGSATQILGSLALAATDYRARYAMNTNAVLEVVAPYWVREMIRSDLAWRQGVELLAVSNAEIDGYFAPRNVRVQWVNDYQVRGSGQPGHSTTQNVWPTTATVMVYAAGTFLHGTGMSLDLGVVRDSVLNAENDFTAAWAEESHLIAKVGHASRQYTIALSNSSITPPAGATAPNL